MTCSPASRTRLGGPGQPVHQTAVLPLLHLSIAHLKCSIRSARLARRKSAGAAPSLTPLTPILLVSRETRDAFLGAGRRAEFSESFPRPPEAWHCEYDSAIEMLPKTAFLLKRRRGPGNPRRDLARPRLGSGLRQKKRWHRTRQWGYERLLGGRGGARGLTIIERLVDRPRKQSSTESNRDTKTSTGPLTGYKSTIHLEQTLQ